MTTPIPNGDDDVAPATVEVNAPTPHVVSETDVLLDAIRRGVTANADEPARAAARDACRAIAIALGAAPIEPSTTTRSEPERGAGTGERTPVAGSPVKAIVDTLKKLSPDQLLDLAIQRLRVALPSDSAAVAPSEPVRFQLVQIPAPPAGRYR